MTATSSAGTPPILTELAIIVTLVVGFATVFMALGNVQRQIRVTAREGWMREFREQFADLMSHYAAYLQYMNQSPQPGKELPLTEQKRAT